MQIIITPQAEKQLLRLPKKDRGKVQKKLVSLKENVFAGKKLRGEFEGQYSLRVWPYRIIYQISTKSKTIYVVSIIHRQGAYN